MCASALSLQWLRCEIIVDADRQLSRLSRRSLHRLHRCALNQCALLLRTRTTSEVSSHACAVSVQVDVAAPTRLASASAAIPGNSAFWRHHLMKMTSSPTIAATVWCRCTNRLSSQWLTWFSLCLAYIMSRRSMTCWHVQLLYFIGLLHYTIIVS